MEIITMLFADALFLALITLLIYIDRRVGRLELLRRSDLESQSRRDDDLRRAVDGLRVETASENAASDARGFDEGLADILGYSLERFADAVLKPDEEVSHE